MSNSNNSNTFNDYRKILNIGNNHQIAFTDGGCHPNNKSKNSRGGYASIFTSGLYENTQIYGNLNISEYNASNIRAEGMAIYQTLKFISKCNENWEKLTIVTDCEFWINMIEQYMPKWKKETFKEKQNTDLTEKIWMIYNELIKKGEICFIHMRSHNKDGWKKYQDDSYEKYCYLKNDMVDKLCNFARLNLQAGTGMIKHPNNI
jgi:ribonuclease HI